MQFYFELISWNGHLNRYSYKPASSNSCWLSQRHAHVRKVDDNEVWKRFIPLWRYRRMACIKYPFNGDLSERQKNRHRSMSVIYDSRELPSVTNSRRIKYEKAGKRRGWRKSEEGEKKRQGLRKKRKVADRWSLEITGCSNICIAADDESRRAAKRSSSRAYIPAERIIRLRTGWVGANGSDFFPCLLGA